MRPTLLAELLCATTMLVGCASPCARVQRAHAEVTQRTDPGASGDHLRLSIPLALIHQVIARELRQAARDGHRLVFGLTLAPSRAADRGGAS